MVAAVGPAVSRPRNSQLARPTAIGRIWRPNGWCRSPNDHRPSNAAAKASGPAHTRPPRSALTWDAIHRDKSTAAIVQLYQDRSRLALPQRHRAASASCTARSSTSYNCPIAARLSCNSGWLVVQGAHRVPPRRPNSPRASRRFAWRNTIGRPSNHRCADNPDNRPGARGPSRAREV